MVKGPATSSYTLLTLSRKRKRRANIKIIIGRIWKLSKSVEPSIVVWSGIWIVLHDPEVLGITPVSKTLWILHVQFLTYYLYCKNLRLETLLLAWVETTPTCSKQIISMFFYLDPLQNHAIVTSWCMHYPFPFSLPLFFVTGRTLLSKCFTSLPRQKI